MDFLQYNRRFLELLCAPSISREYYAKHRALSDSYICFHEDSQQIELRWQLQGKLGKRFRYQCMRCGHLLEMVARAHVANPDTCHEVNKSRRAEWLQERALALKSLYADYRRRSIEERKTVVYQISVVYDEYIRSTEWARLRKLVLERDQFLCQGCLMEKATQVHHLTYAHLGCELLYELVSLCRDCHELAHAQRVYDEGVSSELAFSPELPQGTDWNFDIG